MGTLVSVATVSKVPSPVMEEECMTPSRLSFKTLGCCERKGGDGVLVLGTVGVLRAEWIVARDSDCVGAYFTW